MQTQPQTKPTLPDNLESASCPVADHANIQQKTARRPDYSAPSIECDSDGTWHIRDFKIARQILRGSNAHQAGFNAELITKVPGMTNTPILYLEGKEHHQQRKQTARYFAPKVVSDNYRRLMERLVDQIINEIEHKRRVDLSKLSLKLAVRVAAEVVGLTNSRLPGMAKRLEAFFEGDIHASRWTPKALINSIRGQTNMASFFFLDVKPAIKARKRKQQEDVISHLVAHDYNNIEILTECVTYAAAGMATTREFISVATWHFLEQPELRQRYLIASEKERYAILEEILRLEPVVSHLYRRASSDIAFEHSGTSYTIPEGAKIDLYIYNTNADKEIVGEQPLSICPARELQGTNIPQAMMSFGDGHHRCPGSYIAIQESDILLQRLLSLDNLHIVRTPDLSWRDLISSYELRNFVIAL